MLDFSVTFVVSDLYLLSETVATDSQCVASKKTCHDEICNDSWCCNKLIRVFHKVLLCQSCECY